MSRYALTLVTILRARPRRMLLQGPSPVRPDGEQHRKGGARPGPGKRKAAARARWTRACKREVRRPAPSARDSLDRGSALVLALADRR